MRMNPVQTCSHNKILCPRQICLRARLGRVDGRLQDAQLVALLAQALRLLQRLLLAVLVPLRRLLGRHRRANALSGHVSHLAGLRRAVDKDLMDHPSSGPAKAQLAPRATCVSMAAERRRRSINGMQCALGKLLCA